MVESVTKPPETAKPPRPAILISQSTMLENPLQLSRLLLGLADESVPVTLVCPPGADIKPLLSGSVEIVRYPAFDLPFMGHHNKKLLLDSLSKISPNLLHCLCPRLAHLTRQLCAALQLPYLLNINSMQSRWHHAPVSTQYCAKIIVPSKIIAKNTRYIYPQMAGRIKCINPGVFVPPDTACFRHEDSITSIIAAQAVRNARDYEMTLKVLKRIAQQGHEFMLVVTCHKKGEKRFRRMLRQYDLLQRVVVLPRIEPWRPIVQAGDITIMPQGQDSFNFFLLEAMAVGTAVIACPGPVDELIVPDTSCVTFDPEDENSLYDRLTEFMDHKEKAQQLALRTQRFIKQNYSVSTMASSVLRAYRDALAQGHLQRAGV